MGFSRTRTQGGFSTLAGQVYGGSLGGPFSYTTLSAPIGVRKEMSDTVTPNFRSLQRRGGIANSPMSMSLVEKSDILITRTWRSSSWIEDGDQPITTFGGLPAFPAPFSDSMALAAAVNQANAGITPNYAMVAVTMAELDKTIHMFRSAGDVARSLFNIMIVAARSLKGKKNTIKNQRKAMQDIADNWLLVRYGLLPTIYDIQGVLKSFSKPFNQRETSRGTATVSRSGSGTVVGSWRGTYGYSYSWKQEASYRSGVMYESTSDLTSQYSSRLGLSFADALTVPWELVRLSFVVDWFIDIGDWLRAVTPKPGVKTLAAWTVSRGVTEMTMSSPFVNCTAPDFIGTCSGVGSAIHRYTDVSRTTDSIPTIPGYGSGLSINRSIDAAFLSFQALRGLLNNAASVRL